MAKCIRVEVDTEKVWDNNMPVESKYVYLYLLSNENMTHDGKYILNIERAVRLLKLLNEATLFLILDNLVLNNRIEFNPIDNQITIIEEDVFRDVVLSND